MTVRQLGTLRLVSLALAFLLSAIALQLDAWNGITLLALIACLAFVASLYPKAHP